MRAKPLKSVPVPEGSVVQDDRHKTARFAFRMADFAPFFDEPSRTVGRCACLGRRRHAEWVSCDLHFAVKFLGREQCLFADRELRLVVVDGDDDVGQRRQWSGFQSPSSHAGSWAIREVFSAAAKSMLPGGSYAPLIAAGIVALWGAL